MGFADFIKSKAAGKKGDKKAPPFAKKDAAVDSAEEDSAEVEDSADSADSAEDSAEVEDSAEEPKTKTSKEFPPKSAKASDKKNPLLAWAKSKK